MKIAYFGFDLFYDCLEQIKQSGNEIVKIFTCKVDGVYEFSDRVYAFAKENNIEITDKKVEFSDIILLSQKGCDLLFSAGYYYKIPIVDSISGVNIHPAILPNGRGPWPQPVTILKDLKKSGVTLHKLAKEFDTGEIVLQKVFNVNNDENLETLTEKNAYYAKIITKKFFENPEHFLENSFCQTKGEYWPEPTEAEMSFSVDDDFEKIDIILRAFYGFKCVMINKNDVIYIKKGKVVRTIDDTSAQLDCFKVDKGYVIVSEYA